MYVSPPDRRRTLGTGARLSALLTVLALVLSQPAWAANPAESSYAYAPALGAASPSLDVYTATGATNAPVLVYVHGGAWVAGRKSAVNAKPRHFTEAGYVFVSLDYRLAPAVRIEQQLDDIDAALGWIAANITALGGDPGNIQLMGHSAGAHLVSMTALAPRANAKRLLAQGALRGVIANDTRSYDIAGIAAASPGGTLPRLYANVFSSDPARWQALSPIRQIRARAAIPPFLVLYSGQGNNRVRATFATDFANALRRAGARAALFDGGRYSHRSINVGIGKTGDITAAIDAFLAANR